jgi:hypothetical protein
MSQRIIASVHFLKECGERHAEETVSAALYDLRLGNTAADSVPRLMARYKATRVAQLYNQPLDDLLDCWLEVLYVYLRPLVSHFPN